METENKLLKFSTIDLSLLEISTKPTTGKILKALRILAGYEQKELAEKVGINQSAISK